MNRAIENDANSFFSFRKFASSQSKDNELNSKLFRDVQSVIDDDLSEKASNNFAESYGLVAKIIDGEWNALCNRDYPSLVKLEDGRHFLVIRANDYGILLFDQKNNKSSIVTKDLFLARWTGQAVTFFRKPSL